MPPTQNFGSVGDNYLKSTSFVQILCSMSFLNNCIDQITVFIAFKKKKKKSQFLLTNLTCGNVTCDWEKRETQLL